MDIIIFVLYLVVFLYSVILHEIAHGYVALRFGDDTAKMSGRLSLNPLVHLDWFGSLLFPAMLFFSTGFAFGYAKPVPVNPFRLQGGPAAYRWVSLAGIITNFCLAILSAFVLKIGLDGFDLGLRNAGVIFFQFAFMLNLVLAVFNSIPLPGFDGFNFLNTFAWFNRIISKTPLGNPMFLANYGIVISLLILLVFWAQISSIVYFFLSFFSRIFGI